MFTELVQVLENLECFTEKEDKFANLGILHFVLGPKITNSRKSKHVFKLISD